MKPLVLLTIFSAILAPVLLFAGASPYSRSTIVLYNKSVLHSKTLASYYVTQRGIPRKNLIGLDCPAKEEITRHEFETTIAEPLRQKMLENEWWGLKNSLTGGVRPHFNKMHVIALMYGMPLKVKGRPILPKFDPATGEQVDKADALNDQDGASVDSELSVLGFFNSPIRSSVANPYYKKTVAFPDAKMPYLFLVGRIDGPTMADAKRLIDDADRVEKRGLWGRAYLDLSKKGGDYRPGDKWISNIAGTCEKVGIPYLFDNNPETLTEYYPMTDAALYFGWYATNANGPFSDPDFRFKPGAIACHIHSFSAGTLKSQSKNWAGPLVSKGAATVIGNVYEPFLTATTNLDVFFERLLEGYCMIEAMYMAQPRLSWMAVAIGDPLYRPYMLWDDYDSVAYEKDTDRAFKALHIAHERWYSNPDRMKEALLAADESIGTGINHEFYAAAAREKSKDEEMTKLLKQAEQLYKKSQDKIRTRLLIADHFKNVGSKTKAITTLEKALKDFQGEPGSKAITGVLKKLDPNVYAPSPK